MRTVGFETRVTHKEGEDSISRLCVYAAELPMTKPMMLPCKESTAELLAALEQSPA